MAEEPKVQQQPPEEPEKRRRVRFRRPRIERMISEEEIDIGGKLFPMAGVSFLILLMLVAMARDLFSKSKIQVDVPRSTRIETELEENIAVTITKDSRVYVNDQEVTFDTLDRVIERAHRQDPDTAFWYTKLVLIRADKSLPFGTVLKALDAAKKAKSQRVAFAVIREKEKQP